MYLLLISLVIMIVSFFGANLVLEHYRKRKIYSGPIGKIVRDFSTNPENWADYRHSGGNSYLHKDGLILISLDHGDVRFDPLGEKIGRRPHVYLEHIKMTKVQRTFCEQIVENRKKLLKEKELQSKLDSFKNLVDQTIVEEIKPKEVEKSPSSDMKIPPKIQKKISDFGTM